MAHSYNSPAFYNNSYNPAWNDTDTSDFLFDSPQPEPAKLPQEPRESNTQGAVRQNGQNQSKETTSPGARAQYSQTNDAPDRLLPAPVPANPSSTSLSSDHSSSSDSTTMQRKRKVSLPRTPSDILPSLEEDIPSHAYNNTKDYGASPLNFNGFNDGTYPSTNPIMGDPTLDELFQPVKSERDDLSDSPDYLGDNFGMDENFGTSHYDTLQALESSSVSPVFGRHDLNTIGFSNGKSQMTVQPSRTFNINRSDADSPMMIDSHESSPGAFFSPDSPNPINNDISGLQNFSTNNHVPMTSRRREASPTNFDLGAMSDSNSASTSTPPKSPSKSGAHWPCRLDVAATPDKSRVETQIPIELTLHNVPKGITQVHLPAHTISKPKFQCKPEFEQSADTLELSAMLVCASAMVKEGVEVKAFDRAARDDIFVDSEENQPASAKGNPDDTDPDKPLNGGPVAICSGCITRERKRAARKKTKKQDEEDEWAKDEAKRVIVFNCAEVRDWCVLGSKEAPVKDEDTHQDTMFVKAPMRIACYCRHQSEKVGFQVIFTLRTIEGEVLAQAITQSIMITDDHKQPTGGPSQGGMMFNGGNNMGMNMFPHSFGMNPGAFQHQPMPFRNAMSSSDLQKLGHLANHFATQRRPPSFSRQSSGYGSAATSNATATPRNLSRPASPTTEPGPSAKKRRGGASQSKLPPGLAMTRMDNYNSLSQYNSQISPGPTSAGPTSGGFSFAPHGFGPLNYGGSQSGDPFSGSVPGTPLKGMASPPFGSQMDNNAEMYRFYSAPTSQHGSRATSRATSPASTARAQLHHRQQSQNQTPGQSQQQQGAFNPHLSHPADGPAAALSRLPPGFDVSDPPIIQRIIPNYGNVAGGEDITLLGSGFVAGLEVMFGDVPSPSAAFWGPTTLVAKAPASVDYEEGQVAVVFRHQHPKATISRELLRVREIMPSQQVLYTYLEEEGERMRMLSAGMSSASMREGRLGR